MVLYLLLLFVIIGFGLGAYFSSPAYSGPESDHFDGKRFFNPWGLEPTKGYSDVIKWAFTREPGKWDEMPLPAPGTIPASREEEGWVITFVNHATLLLQADGKNILFDPIWSERTSPVSFLGPKRQIPPGVAFDELPPIDLVIYSHNHYDHLDVPTLKKLLAAHDPAFIVPLGVDLFLEKYGAKKVKALDWWEKTIWENIPIHAIPARHFSGRGLLDRDKSLWAGFTLALAGGRVYFAGDTGYAPFFKDIPQRIGPIKLAMVPVGAFKPRWFMSPVHTDPEEGVQIFEDVQAEYGIPIHFGTFPLADEAQGEAEAELSKVLRERKLHNPHFKIMKNGEQWRLED